MKIILSPAKTMNLTNIESEEYKTDQIPEFVSESKRLQRTVKKLSYKKAKLLWNVSENLTRINYDRFKTMDVESDLTPAIFAYEGLVYKQINIDDFSETELNYLNEHLRIISGFYGLVKPMDGIVPYRLEMSNKLSVGKSKNLYDFWGDKIYQALISELKLDKENIDGSSQIINLASKEYSRVIEKHLKPADQFINVEFVHEKNGKIIQLGTDSKRARGDLVRFMAKNNVTSLKQLQQFETLDLHYSDELSKQNKLVFLREN